MGDQSRRCNDEGVLRHHCRAFVQVSLQPIETLYEGIARTLPLPYQGKSMLHERTPATSIPGNRVRQRFVFSLHRVAIVAVCSPPASAVPFSSTVSQEVNEGWKAGWVRVFSLLGFQRQWRGAGQWFVDRWDGHSLSPA